MRSKPEPALPVASVRSQASRPPPPKMRPPSIFAELTDQELADIEEAYRLAFAD
jgi:hypothetical protein